VEHLDLAEDGLLDGGRRRQRSLLRRRQRRLEGLARSRESPCGHPCQVKTHSQPASNPHLVKTQPPQSHSSYNPFPPIPVRPISVPDLENPKRPAPLVGLAKTLLEKITLRLWHNMVKRLLELRLPYFF